MSFLTYNSTHIQSIYEGTSMWPYVQLTLNLHFFLCDYTEIEDGEKLTTTISVFDYRYLLKFKSNHENKELKSIYLICPGWLNNSEKWKMYEIKYIQIAKFISNETECKIQKFICVDGEEIIYDNHLNQDSFNLSELLFETVIQID